MKDVPALLVAYLAKKDVGLMKPSFRASSTTERCSVTSSRSSARARSVASRSARRRSGRQAWFANRTPETIFRNALGAQPSMADVIKMVRPAPKNDAGQKTSSASAYGYLIGKTVDAEQLPPVVKAFEAFKKGEGAVPDVPSRCSPLCRSRRSTGPRSRGR